VEEIPTSFFWPFLEGVLAYYSHLEETPISSFAQVVQLHLPSLL
jgi:hypothetical protein